MSVGFRYHVLPCCLEIQSVLSLYNQTSLFLSIYLHYFSVEAEFATTEKEMTERHAAEIAALESGGGDEADPRGDGHWWEEVPGGNGRGGRNFSGSLDD